MSKRPMIIIAGPTAVGKTSTSIQLAKRINGEIISADSMQVYRGMDIGTAKIRKEEMDGVPHHLLDFKNPEEGFSVAEFQELAMKAYEDIASRGKVPIFVGGTGFYLQAMVYDIQFQDMEQDETYRLELNDLASEKGTEYIHKMLEDVDAESAATIPHQNLKRVIRALEYYKQTGEKISYHNEEQRKRTSPYDLAFFVLTMDRDLLYDRINYRVDLMMEEGLEEEVRGLIDKGITWDMVAMKGLGYKEFRQYLEGDESLEEAVYCLKRDTRHFAKRQLTWFRREKAVTWIEVDKLDMDTTKITDFMVGYIENNLHIS